MSIAASGMEASATWMNTIASNVANANDPSALVVSGTPYTGYQPTTVAMSTAASGGVTATVVPTTSAYGVDPSTTAVDQVLALQSYKANADVFRAAEEMMKTTLNITA